MTAAWLTGALNTRGRNDAQGLAFSVNPTAAPAHPLGIAGSPAELGASFYSAAELLQGCSCPHRPEKNWRHDPQIHVDTRRFWETLGDTRGILYSDKNSHLYKRWWPHDPPGSTCRSALRLRSQRTRTGAARGYRATSPRELRKQNQDCTHHVSTQSSVEQNKAKIFSRIPSHPNPGDFQHLAYPLAWWGAGMLAGQAGRAVKV